MRKALIILTLVMMLAGTAAVADGMAARFDQAEPAYSPVPIWWWSGDPITRAGITEQMKKMRDGGIYNAIILNLAPSGPLYGSAPDEPPFLSDEWWELFAHTVDTADELAMKLWFYDQLGFSGAGLQARLVRDNPSFRGVALDRVVEDVTGPTTVRLETPPAGTALAAFTARHVEQETETAVRWIWMPDAPEEEATYYFRRPFHLLAQPESAHVNITCDNGYKLYVNGELVGEESVYEESGWRQAERYEIAPLLTVGENVIAVEAVNLGGPGGLAVELFRDGAPLLVSDADFRVAEQHGGDDAWLRAGFEDTEWYASASLGAAPTAPWQEAAGLETAMAQGLGTPIEQVRNVSGELADGAIEVEVPAGAHRVMLYYTTPGGFDYHNAEACTALLDIVHGEIARRFPEALGTVIAGSFQDEFPAVPRFSAQMPAAFEERMGYKFIDVLPALHDDVRDRFGNPEGPDTIQVRCDANDAAAALAEEAFFIPLYAWHEAHGMLCGYDQTVRDADPLRGERYYVDYFKTMRHYSVPGQDMDGNVKPHQSIADLYQRPRVWMEAFHSSGWGQTMEEIAVLLHPWLAGGATLYNPHAIYYSTHGSYYEWAPPDTGWRQPYFHHHQTLADYVARLCAVLSEGKHVVRTGIVHPASTVHAYTGHGPHRAQAQAAQRRYWQIQEALDRRAIDYITVDEDSIINGAREGGTLAMGDVALDVLVLPGARVLKSDTAVQLAAFAEAGGQLIVAGTPPERPADRTRAADWQATRDKLVQAAAHVDNAGAAVAAIADAVPPVIAEGKPTLHRRIGDRDFFFVLSDTETKADSGARWNINERDLWKTGAAQGDWLHVTFPGDGLPEVWDALTGEIRTVRNFERRGNETRVAVNLADTPAPLLALKPAAEGLPQTVASNMAVQSLSRDGDTLSLVGMPRITPDEPPANYHARVAFEDAVFEGSTPAHTAIDLTIGGVFDCRLEPTMENRDGSFAWPPSDGPIPVETRAFAYQPETADADTSNWHTPDFEAEDWETVIASYGPRAAYTGPIALPEGKDVTALEAPPATDEAAWKPVVYSLRLGIDEDPVFSSALGGKGRIPESFIDLGEVKANAPYLVRATVILPEEAAGEPLDVLLRVGGVAHKRVFLNGAAVDLQGSPTGRTQEGTTTLQPGPNTLTLVAARPSNGRLRLFYQFLEPDAQAQTPEWIWSRTSPPGERTRFLYTLTLPEEAEIADAQFVAALGDLHQIAVNGTRIADQGNFDAYFMSRAEQYSIAEHLKPGDNRIEVVARDAGQPTGFFADGLVTLADGTRIPFMSGPKWHCVPVGQPDAEPTPVKVLFGPARGYMGDPAMLRLWTRPHPLPKGGWLADQESPPDPLDQLVYARSVDTPSAGWYRFRLPPGATGIVLPLAAGAEARLWVNGREYPLRERAHGHVAALLEPDATRRIAVLRVESVPGFEAGAALREPITYDMGPGRITLGSWDELGLPHYSGGMVYEKSFYVHATGGVQWTLDLGRVRGTAEVEVNGEPCGTRIWHPYRFDVTGVLETGENTLSITVYNTLGPHFDVGHPSKHVFKGHSKSGIFGPITLHRRAPVRMHLNAEPREQEAAE
ncbi:MAG: glycosylhydrolase-like jelly roll fold domain-containing protein [Candidatus Hydrogenedentota bacterium]